MLNKCLSSSFGLLMRNIPSLRRNLIANATTVMIVTIITVVLIAPSFAQQSSWSSWMPIMPVHGTCPVGVLFSWRPEGRDTINGAAEMCVYRLKNPNNRAVHVHWRVLSIAPGVLPGEDTASDRSILHKDAHLDANEAPTRDDISNGGSDGNSAYKYPVLEELDEFDPKRNAFVERYPVDALAEENEYVASWSGTISGRASARLELTVSKAGLATLHLHAVNGSVITFAGACNSHGDLNVRGGPGRLRLQLRPGPLWNSLSGQGTYSSQASSAPAIQVVVHLKRDGVSDY